MASLTDFGIPADNIVKVDSSVLSAGGTALSVNGMMLTNSNRIPNGTVQEFSSATGISDVFGASSDEVGDATVYFGGYELSTRRPAKLLVVNYPTASVGAYLRGGTISGMALADLQAISGVLTITVDGSPHTSSSVNLSSATSFSAAAQTITTALGLVGPTKAVVTGSIGAVFVGTGSGTNLTVASVSSGIIVAGMTITGTGISGTVTIVSQTSGSSGAAGVYVTSAVTTASSATITGTSTLMTVSAVSSGTIAIGQQVTGSGITAGTFVTALGTGVGGVGNYTVTNAQQVVSETLTMITPTVSYDSLSGAFTIVSGTTGASSTIGFGSGTLAAPLYLTEQTTAVTSQGSIASVPADFMTALTKKKSNWVTFWTCFDPDGGSGSTQKNLFAAWMGNKKRYAYLMEDTDATPSASGTATSSAGYKAKLAGYDGVLPISVPSTNTYHHAAFAAGVAASFNYEQTNGRTTLFARRQDGLAFAVGDETVANNLLSNGYNFYANYSTPSQLFKWFQDGRITGTFQWFDSYINAIVLKADLQQAGMSLLQNVGSIPYNPQGYGMIRAMVLRPINKHLNFGTIRIGVTLDSQQQAEVNALVGFDIGPTLTTYGWYLSIKDATPQTRQARESPSIILLYMDGQSIQKIELASILVQ